MKKNNFLKGQKKDILKRFEISLFKWYEYQTIYDKIKNIACCEVDGMYDDYSTKKIRKEQEELKEKAALFFSLIDRIYESAIEIESYNKKHDYKITCNKFELSKEALEEILQIAKYDKRKEKIQLI